MNWTAIRKHNATASARKAKREAFQNAIKRKVEELGGPVTVEELRGAERKVYPPAHGYCHERNVMVFRGREWVVWEGAAVPFCLHRQDPEYLETGYGRTVLPMTPAATKWYAKEFPQLCITDL